ncbi:hypothetical protein I4U23_013158 [Adineta vaga]|nr:hypothetical protein I4U23_013158 [Adineta vaga]
MISNNESSLLSRKTIVDPHLILQTYHKNCMYKIKTESIEKTFCEVSTQCENSLDHCHIDEQTQVSQSNESKDTQTSYLYSRIPVKNHLHSLSSKSALQHQTTRKHTFINPYALIDRVNQGEDFLKFLYKQNSELNLIYTTFLKHLLKYTNTFLLSLQQKHSLYDIYRQDMIRYVIILQEHINELRTKVNILREANKNFALFRKHFHKTTRYKSELEDLLIKHDKHQKRISDQSESVKYQEQFFEIYQRTCIQLRTIEQQRLVAIREQMKFAMNLTLTSFDDYNLFASTNFDQLLNSWDDQYKVAIDHWSHFPAHANVSQQYPSLLLLDEIKQIVDEYHNHRQFNFTHKNTQMITLLNESNS